MLSVKIKYILLIVTLAMISCETADFGSIFVSYETADERFDQSMVWNQTHPYQEIQIPDETYTLFAASDIHVGGTVNFKQFFSDAVNSEACASVLVGDLCSGKREDYINFVQALPRPDSIPTFSMLGNHDLFFGGWESYYDLIGSSTYYFTVSTPSATDLYICTDSGSGTLGAKQFEWLKDLLETERENYRFCFVFTHMNLFRDRHTGSTSPVVQELYALTELFADNNVNMVITGHDHKKSTSRLGNTTYIILDALEDSNETAGYLEVNVLNDSIRYSFYNF